MFWAVSRIDCPGFDEVHRIPCGDTVAFVALHALIQGRAFGGIRIRPYESEQAALDDALGLARAMSRKVVMAGLGAGGAKTVLVAPPADRAAAVQALGAFIESLGGRYHCGPDMGFTAEDEANLRKHTQHLACTVGLGEATARGVRVAMQAIIEPRTVAVQGLGAVGMPLARMLAADGVRVIASDLEPSDEFETVAPDAIYDVRCDVFAPCAAGGVLDEARVARLRCRVVCGGANNPLTDDDVADVLDERGIVYVPDFLANAGAVIAGGSAALGEADQADARIESMGERVRNVVERARYESRTPLHVARSEADERLAAARS